MVGKISWTKKKNDGFKYLILDNSWIMKHEGIVKNDITPSEKIREKELHFKMQEEEYLSSNKNVDEDFEDELNDDEPPWKLR